MTKAILPGLWIVSALMWTASFYPSIALGDPLDESIVSQLQTVQRDCATPSADDVASAKNALLAAADRLDAYLQRSGDKWPELGESLEWKTTRASLETLDSADASEMAALLRTCRANVPGMARPEVVQFRHRLMVYVRALRGMRAAENEAEISEHLEGLQATAVQYAAERNSENRRQLLEHIAWLRDRGLAVEAIGALQEQLDRPNFYVHAGREFLTASLGGPVQEDTPVRDVILDTNIVGTGVVTGMVDVRLVPNQEQAVLEFVFQGKLNSKTVGYNGPVQLHSVAQTDITARQRITMVENGLQLGSTSAQARSASRLKAICTRARGGIGRLIRGVAKRQYAKSHARADCIAARHAERDFRTRVKEETEEALLPANKSYLADFRTPLIRLDQYPQLMQFSTGQQALHMAMLQAQDSQLAAPDEAPPASNSDVAIRIHETFANNFADGLFAGTTLSDEEMKREVNQLLGMKVAESDSRSARPVFVTFADQNPIELIVGGGRVTVTVRGQRFTQGNSVYPAMNVVVCYQLESTPAGTRAVLCDEPTVIPPRLADGEPGRLSFRETALRRLLKNLLDRDLEQEIELEPFEIEVSEDRKVMMEVERLAAIQGWISCDLRLADSKE